MDEVESTRSGPQSAPGGPPSDAAARPAARPSEVAPAEDRGLGLVSPAGDRAWLLALVAALLGFALISAVDVGCRRGVPTLAEVVGRTPLPQGRTLLERTAFLNWQAMSLLLVGLSVGLGVASVRSLRNVRASRPGVSLTILVWVCIAALAALFVVGASISPGSWTVLRGIDHHLRTAGSVAWEESGLGRLTFLPMRFSVAASILVATAMLTLLMHPPKTRPHVVAERLQRLKLLLYLTAITLAAGVLATRAGYLWLFSFLVECPKDDFWVQSGTLVQAASLRVGVLYSLYLAMLYLPVHWLLQRQAESLVATGPGARPPAGPGGPASGELTLRNWQETVAQFVALVAPAVTGAASNLIALKLG